jgi:hypothetical protein
MVKMKKILTQNGSGTLLQKSASFYHCTRHYLPEHTPLQKPLHKFNFNSPKVAGSIADESLDFSLDLILPAAIWNLGSTQLLTETSIRNLSMHKGRPQHKADNLTAIYEPIA